MFIALEKVELENSFMNTKYDIVGGYEVFILRKIQASIRVKELDDLQLINIANEFIVHNVLNKLSTSFDKLKGTNIAQEEI